MGLEDFKSDDKYSIGNVSTRKKIKNVKLSKDSWRHLLYHDPHWARYFASELDEKEIKAIVEIIDYLIENGRDGMKRDQEAIDDLKQVRGEIVEEHLKKD